MNISLVTTGCRTNQEEIETIRTELMRTGCTIVDDAVQADVFIVNSCSVTSHAEAKVRRLLHAIARRSPRAKILITGCMAQQYGDQLLAAGMAVSWVVGNARKGDIPAILRDQGGGVFLGKIKSGPLSVPHTISPPNSGGRTRFHLKIQEGCDNACAYCIVPLLRGRSRSAHDGEIVDTCRSALDAGYKEIVLTGTHIGQFRGEGGQGRLLQLVERLLHIGGDFRLRLSSLDPGEISGGLLALAGEGHGLCDHLHISVQSLSGDVLKAMKRPHETLDDLVEKLADFRGRYPCTGFGADFIVGFPGETDAMFEATLRNAEKIGFSYAHIFRYSLRPGTAAAALPRKIPESVKRSRREGLRAVIEKSRQKFIEGQKGTTRRIIVEQERPVRGVTSNYLSVELHGASAAHNSWLDVVIEGTDGNGRICRVRGL